MKIRTKLFLGLSLTLAAVTATIGGTIAYLTDYDTAVNEFTIGKIDIDLEEPSWDPEQNDPLLPMQEVKKDPQVKNTGKNDAFVYLEVSVPVKKVITAKDNGARNKAADTELFTFKSNKDWTPLSVSDKDGYKVYVYAYDKIVKPNETTGTLFDTVKFVNLVEGQLDGQSVNIPVRAYAIQTAATGGDGTNVPDQAKTAFDKYLNQNKNQPGAVTGK